MDPPGRIPLYLASTILFVVSYASAKISVPATSCSLQHEALGINFNLTDILGGNDRVEIPNFNVNGTQKSMMLGLCRGIKPSVLKCEGKNNSLVSACLYDPIENNYYGNISKNNSKIVGTILKSRIEHSGDRFYLESFASNSTCPESTPNKTIPLGTRIEFFCSPKTSDKPTFSGYRNCTYIFEWASKNVCLESHMADSPAVHDAKNINISATPAAHKSESLGGINATRLSDTDLKINLDEKPKTAEQLHKETLKDVSKVLDIDAANKTKSEAGKSPSKEDKKDRKAPTSSPNKVDKTVLTPIPPSVKPVNTEQMKNSSVATPSTKQSGHIDKKEELTVSPGKLNQENLNQPPKMNKLHKFFMIGLILSSLAAFVVVIFILDKKTRLRIPLGNIRRQVSQAFQQQPVPYTRVDQFNDSLVL